MLNKAQMIEAYRDHFDTHRSHADDAVSWFFDIMKDELRAGGEIRIKGFGNLHTTSREAYQGRNPRTGEAVEVKAARRPKFVPSRQFIDELNQ